MPKLDFVVSSGPGNVLPQQLQRTTLGQEAEKRASEQALLARTTHGLSSLINDRCSH
jgi:hypothetical protein